jgi:hypothetical protein
MMGGNVFGAECTQRKSRTMVLDFLDPKNHFKTISRTSSSGKTSGWTRVIYSEQEFIYDEVNLSMTFGLDGFQEERF